MVVAPRLLQKLPPVVSTTALGFCVTSCRNVTVKDPHMNLAEVLEYIILLCPQYALGKEEAGIVCKIQVWNVF